MGGSDAGDGRSAMRKRGQRCCKRRAVRRRKKSDRPVRPARCTLPSARRCSSRRGCSAGTRPTCTRRRS
eukprot:2438729-Rhodomonas_salina.1